MDPLSQGVLGSTFSLSSLKKSENKTRVKAALWMGFLSGCAPDLDVLIRSSSDPLLFLEYHRQFTHSLIFIPFGGLICAFLFYYLNRKKLPFKFVYAVCTAGFASHGLLDACTTYGTLLFWPFSYMRVAWNSVSAIDPLFTLPLIGFLIQTYRKGPRYARMGMIYGALYLSFGVIQRERAESFGYEVAKARGHSVIRLEARPTLANLFLWKIIYEANIEGQIKFHVDAVRILGERLLFPGESVDRLDLEDPELPAKDTRSYQDILRFKWFSNDYVAFMPGDKNKIMDVRYSIVPNRFEPLWIISLNRIDEHVNYVITRNSNKRRVTNFLKMLFLGVGGKTGLQ